MGFFKVTFETVAVIVILLGIGYYIAGRKWYYENRGEEFLGKFVVNIVIPMNLFYKVVATYNSRDDLIEIIAGLPVPFISMGVMFVLSYFAAKLFRVPLTRRGAFMNMASLSNTVLVGIAIIEPLLGDNTDPYSLLYYTANTLFFWTLGTYFMRRDAGFDAKVFSKENFKKVLTPPLLAFLLGIAFVLADIPKYIVFTNVLSKVSGMATPISMMYIGSIIKNVDYKKFKAGKDSMLVFIYRFLVSPLVMTGICLLMPLPILMKKTFFLMACMPVMTQCGIMAKEYNADYEFSSTMVAATTVLCIVFVPVYMYLIEAVKIFG